jgi:hydroxymethylpyrimidine/phosphomethylpyrimidine kinase
VVLTVAGSDSGGGAGVQADLKTAAAVGAFGTSVVTSVTAQHTRGVESTHVLPVAEVEAQLDAVFDDFDVAAVKTGMLATTEIVETVAEYAAERDVPFVVDPVMVAASGDRLLAPEAESAYERLIAEATLVTPNADEAAVLTDIEPASEADLRAVGEQLVSAGASAALVKGGHVAGDPVCDVLVRRVNDGDPVQRTNEGDPARRANEGGPAQRTNEADPTRRADEGDPAQRTNEGDPARRADEGNPAQCASQTFTHPRIDTEATHGSGCTLSSSIAARLARGRSLSDAVAGGIDHITRAVRYPLDVGEGPGAVHHAVEVRERAAREATRETAESVLAQFVTADVRPVVPEVGLNLVAATPYAETTGETAAVEGRVTATLSGVQAGRGIRFGASSHVARFLLSAREHDPSLRFAVNCRQSDATVAAMERLDWEAVEIDRSAEPEPDEEGSTMGWAARRAFEQTDGTPDAVFDRGDVGKESMIRVLAVDAAEIARKVLDLSEQTRGAARSE